MTDDAKQILTAVESDCLELFGYQLLWKDDDESRSDFIEQFKEIYDSYDLPDQKYGKVYIYNKICEVVSKLHRAYRDELAVQTAGTEEGEEKEEEQSTVNEASSNTNTKKKLRPFREWNADQWNKTFMDVRCIYTNLIRRDAAAEIGQPTDPTSNKRLMEDSTKIFFGNKQFDNINRFFKMHETLAPYRADLETMLSDAIKNGDGDKPFVLPDEVHENLMDSIDSVGDEKVQAFLSSAFSKDEGRRKSCQEMEHLFCDQTSSLCYTKLYKKTITILRKCVKDALGQPRLFSIYVVSDGEDADNTNDDEREQGHRQVAGRDQRALEKLQKSRRKLDREVNDPLPSAVEAAATARQRRSGKSSRRRTSRNAYYDDDDDVETSSNDESYSDTNKIRSRRSGYRSPLRKKARLDDDRRRSRGSFYSKKKSGQQMKFYDSDDQDDDEVLSEPGRPRSSASHAESPTKFRKSQQKKYKGRRPWSDLEKSAIKDGVRNHGVGKWAKIKDEKSDILEMRTSGQIKDCWRQMVKTGDPEVVAIIESLPSENNEES